MTVLLYAKVIHVHVSLLMSSLYCSPTAKACNADAASNPKHTGNLKAEGRMELQDKHA